MLSCKNRLSKRSAISALKSVRCFNGGLMLYAHALKSIRKSIEGAKSQGDV
jgi:hypothetical protein